VTRYGRADTSFSFAGKHVAASTDLELGRRRARAAALLAMALPGSSYIYQGEELGLPEVEDIPGEQLRDPMHFRSGGVDPGRDGCRVPIPWTGDAPPYGFSPDHAAPWLPQPAAWGELTATAQAADPASMLSLYRTALRLRRGEDGLGDGPMEWLDAGAAVLAFRRGGDFGCVVNLGPEPAPLPAHTEVLLASGELAEGALPQDTAAWLRLAVHPSLTEVENDQ